MGSCLSCLKCMVCCTSREGSICCAIFSAIAVVFLGILSGLLNWQWPYIHGIDNQSKADHARENAYIAAIVYAVIFVMCLVSLRYHNKRLPKNVDPRTFAEEEVQDNLGNRLDTALMMGDSLGNGGPVRNSQVSLR